MESMRINYIDDTYVHVTNPKAMDEEERGRSRGSKRPPTHDKIHTS